MDFWISVNYFSGCPVDFVDFSGFLLDFSRPVRDFWVVAGPSFIRLIYQQSINNYCNILARTIVVN